MEHSEDNGDTRETNRPIPSESSWDSPDPIPSKNLSYYYPSEDCIPYLSEHDDSYTNHSFPSYLSQSFDYRLNNGNQDASIDVASAPTAIAYGWPVVERHYDVNYPNRQPYYHPQQSQALQHQRQVTHVATRETVDSDNIEQDCLDCSIIGAVALSIFSLLFCCICGVVALRLASKSFQLYCIL